MFDSCGTAEACIRAVAPLDEADMRRAVDEGLTVDWHAVPGRQALVGAQGLGLALQPVLDGLGLPLAEADRMRPAAWTTALDHAAADGQGLIDRVASFDGPVERVVLAGGWAHSAVLRESKSARLRGVPLEWPAVAEAGARGAALAAGVAAGLFPRLQDVPAPVAGQAPGMSPIHQTAAVGFDRGAADYERGRPGYPPGAVEHLARVLGLGPGTTVLELGAGTGKLTRLLVGTGARVLAAEPVAGMRAELARALPDVERLDVPAEDTGLAPGSVAAVVAANAFHWFDGDAAIREMVRILGTGGGVGVVWNRRDEADPIMRGISEIVDPYAGEALRFRSGAWRAAFERSDQLTPLEQGHLRLRPARRPRGPSRAGHVHQLHRLPRCGRAGQGGGRGRRPGGRGRGARPAVRDRGVHVPRPLTP